ncbi:MAG: hypothetical protein E5Y63_21455 [Mesorhizobium sp.]|nr:MAG: hypothetical protein E5Y63_21455 [Mesorhizobium sp.]
MRNKEADRETPRSSKRLTPTRGKGPEMIWASGAARRPRRDAMRRILVAVVLLVLLGAAAGAVIYKMLPAQMAKYGGMAFNFYRSFDAPKGTLATEANPEHRDGSTAKAARSTGTPQAPAAGADWPSYNRTVTSDRYSPLAQITTGNVGQMKVLCTYDTGVNTVFETGLIKVDGALIGTTEFDIFSLDPATCAENWRTHEDIPPSILGVNRGAAYWDGMLFRGTQDGQVLAYDFKTGKRLWQTTIADPSIGETVPAPRTAWCTSAKPAATTRA